MSAVATPPTDESRTDGERGERPAPGGVGRGGRSATPIGERPLARDPLTLAAELAAFAVALARAVPGARHHTGEIVRQAALIATGSTAVVLAIAFLAGGSCGLESTALARAFGFDPIAGGFSAWCTLREVVPFVFGYIVAAKVGCGFVAELGAMRVQEEVDALEAMGVRSLAYLAGTRTIACFLVLPAVYLLSIGAAYLAAFLMSVFRFGDVSPGTWIQFFLQFQDGWDVLFSLLKGALIAVWVVLVALYHGYGVRGGPVDVGIATARSMAVSIVGVTLISTLGTLVFWGANARIPIG